MKLLPLYQKIRIIKLPKPGVGWEAAAYTIIPLLMIACYGLYNIGLLLWDKTTAQDHFVRIPQITSGIIFHRPIEINPSTDMILWKNYGLDIKAPNGKTRRIKVDKETYEHYQIGDVYTIKDK